MCLIDRSLSIFSKNIYKASSNYSPTWIEAIYIKTENVRNVAGFAKLMSIRNSRLYGYIK